MRWNAIFISLVMILSIFIAIPSTTYATVSNGSVHVSGYVRGDGTVVSPYTRSLPSEKLMGGGSNVGRSGSNYSGHSSLPSALSALFTVKGFLGAIVLIFFTFKGLIGTIWNTFVFPIGGVQTLYYLIKYTKDKSRLKAIAGMGIAFCITYLIMAWIDIYYFHYGFKHFLSHYFTLLVRYPEGVMWATLKYVIPFFYGGFLIFYFIVTRVVCPRFKYYQDESYTHKRDYGTANSTPVILFLALVGTLYMFYQIIKSL